MPESEDRSAEAQVLVFFALLMESVQKFEWSLKTLTIQRGRVDGRPGLR